MIRRPLSDPAQRRVLTQRSRAPILFKSGPEFAALLERIRGNGVRTIETANRFARNLIVQEKAQGIEIIAADSPGAFVEDTPTATLVPQVLGAVAQFDKAMTVAKLRLARDRVRKRDGKCEGGKSHAEERSESVALARQLHRQGMGYSAISAELERPVTSASAGDRSTIRACERCSTRPATRPGLHPTNKSLSSVDRAQEFRYLSWPLLRWPIVLTAPLPLSKWT